MVELTVRCLAAAVAEHSPKQHVNSISMGVSTSPSRLCLTQLLYYYTNYLELLLLLNLLLLKLFLLILDQRSDQR